MSLRRGLDTKSSGMILNSEAGPKGEGQEARNKFVQDVRTGECGRKRQEARNLCPSSGYRKDCYALGV